MLWFCPSNSCSLNPLILMKSGLAYVMMPFRSVLVTMVTPSFICTSLFVTGRFVFMSLSRIDRDDGNIAGSIRFAQFFAQAAYRLGQRAFRIRLEAHEVDFRIRHFLRMADIDDD